MGKYGQYQGLINSAHTQSGGFTGLVGAVIDPEASKNEAN